MSHTGDLVAYRAALDQISYSVFEVMASIPGSVAPSPARRFKAQNSFSSKPKDPDIPEVVLRLIRQAEVPAYDNDPRGYEKILETLSVDRRVSLRARQLSSYAHSMHVLGEAIGKADSECQEILSTLYRNARYGTVSLLNKSLDNRAERLDDEMNDIKMTMAKMEAAEDHLDGNKVEGLIERWAKLRRYDP